MDTSGLEAMRAEIAGYRPDILDIIEGLQHDLEQKDLQPVTVSEIQSLLAEYQRRDRILTELDVQIAQARDTVLALLEHGYPELPDREIDQAAFDDLDQNRKTIGKAQAQFRPRIITTEVVLTVLEEEPVISS